MLGIRSCSSHGVYLYPRQRKTVDSVLQEKYGGKVILTVTIGPRQEFDFSAIALFHTFYTCSSPWSVVVVWGGFEAGLCLINKLLLSFKMLVTASLY